MAIALGLTGARSFTDPAGTTMAVSYPATVNAGDLLVMHLVTNGGTVTTPAGWTAVYREATLTNPKGGVWVKVAAGGETGTLAVTMTSATGCGIMYTFTGVDTTTPLDVTPTFVANSDAASTSSVVPGLTTVTAGAMLFYANGINSGTARTNSTGTELFDFGSAGGTATKGGSSFYEAFPTPGATGTRTLSQVDSAGVAVGRANWGTLAAFRPAASGTPATVAAVKATGTSAGAAPSLSAGASLTAVPAPGTGTVPVATVSAESTVFAVPATASSLAPAASVAAGASVTAVAATGISSAPVPTVLGAQTASVGSLVATGTASAGLPEVGGGSTVASPASTGTAQALAPAVGVFNSAVVVAVPATATGSAPVPVVKGAARPQAFRAQGTTLARVPTVSAGVSVVAPVSLGTTETLAPVFSGGVGVLGQAAGLSGAALAPVLTAGVLVGSPPVLGGGAALVPGVFAGLLVLAEVDFQPRVYSVEVQPRVVDVEVLDRSWKVVFKWL